ncbi:MAG: hypothetical protein QXH27_05845 [Candidatus Micrarchaeia archaeon]
MPVEQQPVKQNVEKLIKECRGILWGFEYERLSSTLSLKIREIFPIDKITDPHLRFEMYQHSKRLVKKVEDLIKWAEKNKIKITVDSQIGRVLSYYLLAAVYYSEGKNNIAQDIEKKADNITMPLTGTGTKRIELVMAASGYLGGKYYVYNTETGNVEEKSLAEITDLAKKREYGLEVSRNEYGAVVVCQNLTDDQIREYYRQVPPS